MLTVLFLACAAGATLGLARMKLWTLIPATAISIILSVLGGAALGLALDRIILVSFCVGILLQASYLMGAALAEASQGVEASESQQVTGRATAKQVLFWSAQKAIGRELRAYFEPAPLREMPPQLRKKLAILVAH